MNLCSKGKTSNERDAKASREETDRRGVYISTYGCQMNVNDSERMFSLLEMVNYSPVSSPEEASLIILNSCSVREKPVHKIHSEVGRYRKLKDRRPYLKIGVAGCVAQQEKAKLLKDIPLLDFVFGTDAIDELPGIIEKVQLTKDSVNSTRFQHQAPYHIQTMIRNPGVSTFVNITKGCDNFCSFCVVPFTRGRERSRPYEDLVSDVENLVRRGVKEVTLVGQNVNSYKSHCGVDFSGLLQGLAEQTEITRIRYTTPHPKDFNEELVKVIAAHGAKICDYVHLPAQSGNSEVLSRMNRGYDRTEYLEKVRMIRRILPEAAFSTDLIVGFPGETEEQFQDTMTLLKEVQFDTIYAFKYSPRPFTKAAKYTNQVEEEVKAHRLDRLFKLQKEISFPNAQKYVGRKLEVLVEEFESKEKMCMGRSSQNKKVHFKGEKSWVGELVSVDIEKAFPAVLHGVCAK